MVRLPDKSNNQEHEGQGEPPSLADLSQEVKELVRLISASDVSELHLESGQVRIIIKRSMPHPITAAPRASAVYTPPATLPTPAASNPVNLIGHNPTHGEEIALAEGEQLIVAPMVGTFYSAPAPGEPAFVSEGDTVEPGQGVGIIEAMKMMNEIEAEVGGVVTRILAQNAQSVEYGQPLMVVQTSA